MEDPLMPIDTTELLKQWQQGDSKAFHLLIDRVYHELKELAHKKLLDEFHGSGLNTTELLNEACLLLMGKRSLDWQSKKHFLHTAGIAMYRYLVDEARKRKTQRKGGDLVHIQLAEDSNHWTMDVDKILRLEKILNQLEAEDPTLVQISKLRYFAGFTIQETADILEIPTIQVNRKWAFAKAVLSERLNQD